MGFIRSGAVFIFTIILFLVLFVGNIFLTLTWSLEYENVKPQIQNITEKLIQNVNIEESITKEYVEMRKVCLKNDSFNLEYNNITIEIPCNQINFSPKEILKNQTEIILKDLYFKNYSCDFLDCVEKDSRVLISEKSRNYWKSKFYFLSIIFVLIFSLLFLVAKNKHTPFFITGILLIITSFPLKKVNLLANLFSNLLPFNIINIFFSKAESVFTIISILGLFLILLGFAVGFFKWGNKINEFLKKRIQKNKEEEIKKITKPNKKETSPRKIYK